MGNKPNFFGIDIVKVIAIISVISVHFLLNTKFYSSTITGTSLSIQIFYRQLFIICVPLFIIATGFLQWQKKFSMDYLKGIRTVIYIYLILSVFTILVRHFYFHETKTILGWIHAILDFNAIHYAWYVEMYIGLALLIPFLNNIWKAFETKKEFVIFLTILICLTSVASFWNLATNKVPVLSSTELPDYWTQIYPITYYFIGVYIRKHGINLNKKVAILGYFIMTFIEAVILYFNTRNHIYINSIGSYNSVLIVIQSALLFIAVYEMKTPKIFQNKFMMYIISNISLLTLDIFLASYITDKFTYHYFFNHHFTTQQHAILFAPLIVPISFVLAFSIALIRNSLLPLRIKQNKKIA